MVCVVVRLMLPFLRCCGGAKVLTECRCGDGNSVEAVKVRKSKAEEDGCLKLKRK